MTRCPFCCAGRGWYDRDPKSRNALPRRERATGKQNVRNDRFLFCLNVAPELREYTPNSSAHTRTEMVNEVGIFKHVWAAWSAIDFRVLLTIRADSLSHDEGAKAEGPSTPIPQYPVSFASNPWGEIGKRPLGRSRRKSCGMNGRSSWAGNAEYRGRSSISERCVTFVVHISDVPSLHPPRWFFLGNGQNKV